MGSLLCVVAAAAACFAARLACAVGRASRVWVVGARVTESGARARAQACAGPPWSRVCPQLQASAQLQRLRRVLDYLIDARADELTRQWEGMKSVRARCGLHRLAHTCVRRASSRRR